jgi:hypothetical protein
VVASEADAPPGVSSGSGGEGVEVAAESTRPKRVLVTGFNDWKELGDPPNVWRCRDNPSCRLLLGDEASSRPERFEGPLVDRLQASAGGPTIQWDFQTLPVTWGAFETLETEQYDVVINMGLGVYDRFDQLQLEEGAFNERRGTDAAGSTANDPIDPEAARVRSPAEASGIAARLASLAGTKAGAYDVVVAPARPENSYLCNETHYRALLRLEGSEAESGRLAQVYFLHIPYAKDDDYATLADGVAELLGQLVR